MTAAYDVLAPVHDMHERDLALRSLRRDDPIPAATPGVLP
jgi:hypothetical protein